jgi:hypothetical protein
MVQKPTVVGRVDLVERLPSQAGDLVALGVCCFQVRMCVECLPALWNLVDERGFEPPSSSLRTM